MYEGRLVCVKDMMHDLLVSFPHDRGYGNQMHLKIWLFRSRSCGGIASILAASVTLNSFD